MDFYPRIFSKLRIKGHILPNRVMMPSMGSNLCGPDGLITQRFLDYYEARAQGRPGLMVVEAACVHASGKVIENHLMCHDDSALPGLKAAADLIKSHGVPVVAQLFHGGRNASGRLVRELLAPSALKGPAAKTMPRAMTDLEIEAMVECYAQAARRIMVAGFAGAEIHGAHEYLVHQFMTPYANRRSDGYGGGFRGRMRFALEVTRAVRKALGPEGLLLFRLSGDDHVKGGLTPRESARAAQLLEDAGVDLFSVTGGVYETPHMIVPPLPMPVGTHLEAAVQIRQAVQAPVAAVGRFNRPQEVERALALVEVVVVGRAFLADPHWLHKAAQGRSREIRPCIGCNQGCIDRVLGGLPVHCVANPWVGHEGRRAAQRPTGHGAGVVVVGGGLAGMEAALTLGELGHRITLFEEGSRLGGQLRLAAKPPGKAEMAGLADFYEGALRRLPQVEVHLETRATPQGVLDQCPGAVVVAAGSDHYMPDFPGVGEAPVVTAGQVLAKEVTVGKKVAVLGGGNMGSELAHYLAVRGHEVCIIELGLSIGRDLGPARRLLLRRALSEYKIRRYVRAMARRLYPDRVSFLHIRPDGTRRLTDVGPVDTFVSAMGSRPRESLYLALENQVEKLLIIGDALTPARMGEATAEGARAAMEIHHYFTQSRVRAVSAA